MRERKEVSRILRDVGEVLTRRFQEPVRYEEKAPADFVSEADREVESLLMARLREIFPNASFFSEELGSVGNGVEERWILDPLDGTANFIFGVPHFAISAALERHGCIVEAYVYNPVSDELYTSNEEEGQSFINGELIKVSTASSLTKALVVFGFSVAPANIRRYQDDWPHVFGHCRKGMPFLAPSLNICNVARGRCDCFIDFGSSMEGHAAASLILKNAGGAVLNYDGTDWTHTNQGTIAANSALIREMLEGHTQDSFGDASGTE